MTFAVNLANLAGGARWRNLSIAGGFDEVHTQSNWQTPEQRLWQSEQKSKYWRSLCVWSVFFFFFRKGRILQTMHTKSPASVVFFSLFCVQPSASSLKSRCYLRLWMQRGKSVKLPLWVLYRGVFPLSPFRLALITTVNMDRQTFAPGARQMHVLSWSRRRPTFQLRKSWESRAEKTGPVRKDFEFAFVEKYRNP